MHVIKTCELLLINREVHDIGLGLLVVLTRVLYPVGVSW